MPARKIVDESEIVRWFEEGRTYAWMTEEYLRKYDIETTPTLWGNFRRRKGLPLRINRDTELIPWEVKNEHRWAWDITMLRAEARRRAGLDVSPSMIEKVDGWLRTLESEDAVLHYEPDTDQGWFHVARRPDIDKDIIREPDRKLAKGRDSRSMAR